MPTILQQAACGKRKAMALLYDTHKQKIYDIACLLLGQHSFAPEATVYAFRNGWACIKAEKLTTDSRFEQMLLRKTADYAKRRMLKTDSRAFRLPHNRNFLLPSDTAPITDTENVLEAVLAALPLMQRFVFVLYTAGGMDLRAIADRCKLDEHTTVAVLEAIRTNVNRLTRKLGEAYGYDALVEMMSERKGEAVPATVDTRVADSIHRIADPIEKRLRKRIVTIGSSALAALILIGGIVWLSTIGNPYADTDTVVATDTDTNDTTDTDTSEDDNVITSPIIELDDSLTYYADIEIADYGTVTVELDPDAAPITVANFVNLAQEGFYDGLTFHRIIEGTMMQGGDPNGDGSGNAGMSIYGEFADNGWENTLSHTRGTISMARATAYDSASCQFFIMQEDYTSWDGQYAAFGCVTEGMDVVDAVCEASEPTDSNGTISAEAQPVITSVTIRTEAKDTATTE